MAKMISRQTTQHETGNGIGLNFYSILSNTMGATTKKNLVMKYILYPQMLRAWNPIDHFNQSFHWEYILLHVII